MSISIMMLIVDKSVDSCVEKNFFHALCESVSNL